MYTKFRLINEYCLLQVQSLWLHIQLLLLKTLIIVYAILDPSIKVMLLYYSIQQKMIIIIIIIIVHFIIWREGIWRHASTMLNYS